MNLLYLSVRFVGIASSPFQCSKTGLKMRNKKCEIFIHPSNIWLSYSPALEQGCLERRKDGCMLTRSLLILPAGCQGYHHHCTAAALLTSPSAKKDVIPWSPLAPLSVCSSVRVLLVIFILGWAFPSSSLAPNLLSRTTITKRTWLVGHENAIMGRGDA